jgi:hypothetical protein
VVVVGFLSFLRFVCEFRRVCLEWECVFLGCCFYRLGVVVWGARACPHLDKAVNGEG